jgi:NAD(P)-dependent dehydrogenase (short-subunit alcohol dehydrogenase family)
MDELGREKNGKEMHMELNNQIAAIVTGGASGLGEATARELAQQGVKVTLFDLNQEKGEALAQELGGVFAQVDIADEESVIAGVAKAREAHGQERILVNCAGIGIAIKTVGKDGAHPMNFFQKVIEVNLIGTFNCITKSAEGMCEADPVTKDGERGVIINTASVAAFDGQVGQAAYSASKGGIVGMTLPIARDLARNGIRVNTIAPGLFNTPLMAAAPEEVKEALGLQVPFPPRLGHPPEFAQMVRAICENGMMNGETIRLDGAIRMAPR